MSETAWTAMDAAHWPDPKQWDLDEDEEREVVDPAAELLRQIFGAEVKDE